MNLSSKNKVYAVVYAIAIVISCQFSPVSQTEVSQPLISSAHAASANIDVWWPVDMGIMTGVSPVKALVSDKDIHDYQMSWKVDDGTEVPMVISNVDWPHKEAVINFADWKWKGTGPYALTFIARDTGGSVIGTRTVRVLTGTPTISAPVQTAQVAPVTPITAPVAILPPAPIQIIAPLAVPSTPTAPATSVTAEIHPENIEVWWPTAQTVVDATTPLKALLKNSDAGNYKMVYRVDGGAALEMPTNWTDWPHKETVLNFSALGQLTTENHTITFSAINPQGEVVASKNLPVRVQQPTSSVGILKNIAMNPLAQFKLHIGSNKNILAQIASSNDADKTFLQKYLDKPESLWLGNWNGDVESEVKKYTAEATASGAVPTFVAYNIPNRDCGGYSAGGSNSPSGYKAWIESVARGIGNNQAIIILEPDAIPSLDCLSPSDQETRLSLLSFAVTTLKANGKTVVYIDAGNSHWKSAEETASRLKKAGIGSADGFSLNVSNFYTVDDNVGFGDKVSLLVGGKHYVVDTSRNGNGSNGEWCNPWSRALGKAPTTSTGFSLVDAFLWIKKPGESDGTCNGGPHAGTWWGVYALELARNAKY